MKTWFLCTRKDPLQVLFIGFTSIQFMSTFISNRQNMTLGHGGVSVMDICVGIMAICVVLMGFLGNWHNPDVETGYQGADPERKQHWFGIFVIKRLFRLVNQLYFSQFVCQSIQHVGLPVCLFVYLFIKVTCVQWNTINMKGVVGTPSPIGFTNHYYCLWFFKSFKGQQCNK
jgi:hypothetical protein